MMKVDSKSKLGRRSFLHALGTGVVLATGVPLTTPVVADTENNDEKRKVRYKANSADVQAYYRVNRYPN
jgi:hypothetical protein